MTTTMNAPAGMQQEQVRQAEALLFSGPRRRSVAKELYWGRLAADLILPYPRLSDSERPKVAKALEELKVFCDANLDPVEIDRQADIPRTVIDGLANLGVLGMTAPEAVGGRGYSQLAYCRILEELGSRCSSTSIFVNVHHSIGMRALMLFGTPEQKQQWLPELAAGHKLAAFALTEPSAGSDAANVQTSAMLAEDGGHYVLNGEKRYISTGALADVLTVMARTPVPGREGTQITAFLVTPNMPGFRVVEARMQKLGIRGTATGRLAFENMRVPKANILGPLGKGLKVALTVLDFGRTTFGACCTGTAKTCLRLAAEHARTRIQFGRPLGDFELVQKKLARIAAYVYAMQSMTGMTAGMIDRGLEDYMLETAMLKVYSTEALWTIVNDAFQVLGGAAYFTDRPLERMLRDARINQIGEGANEVLTTFIALVGMRDVGEDLRSVRDALYHPWRERATLGRFIAAAFPRLLRIPRLPVQSPELIPHAHVLGRLIHRFGLTVAFALLKNREAILDRQLVQEPIAEAAMELFASACVLSRRDAELAMGIVGERVAPWEGAAATLFLRQSAQRVRDAFRRVGSRDNAAVTELARRVLQAK
jgi:acyl-CoA dehydrogenase family member 9